MAEENKPAVSEVKEPRISRITKTISKKFQTDVKFEILEIAVSYDEEIEWSTLEERTKKSGNITKLLLRDYDETKDKVFAELGLRETKASVKNTLDDSRDNALANDGLGDLGN